MVERCGDCFTKSESINTRKDLCNQECLRTSVQRWQDEGQQQIPQVQNLSTPWPEGVNSKGVIFDATQIEEIEEQ